MTVTRHAYPEIVGGLICTIEADKRSASGFLAVDGDTRYDPAVVNGHRTIHIPRAIERPPPKCTRRLELRRGGYVGLQRSGFLVVTERVGVLPSDSDIRVRASIQACADRVFLVAVRIVCGSERRHCVCYHGVVHAATQPHAAFAILITRSDSPDGYLAVIEIAL